MPKKILRRSRFRRNSLRLRALQTDEPQFSMVSAEFRIASCPGIREFDEDPR